MCTCHFTVALPSLALEFKPGPGIWVIGTGYPGPKTGNAAHH